MGGGGRTSPDLTIRAPVTVHSWTFPCRKTNYCNKSLLTPSSRWFTATMECCPVQLWPVVHTHCGMLPWSAAARGSHPLWNVAFVSCGTWVIPTVECCPGQLWSVVHTQSGMLPWSAVVGGSHQLWNVALVSCGPWFRFTPTVECCPGCQWRVLALSSNPTLLWNVVLVGSGRRYTS